MRDTFWFKSSTNYDKAWTEGGSYLSMQSFGRKSGRALEYNFCWVTAGFRPMWRVA